MNKYGEFIEFFDEVTKHIERPFPDTVQEVYDTLCSQRDNYVEAPLFTDCGIQILEYLQSCDVKSIKAKDIAIGMDVSSRVISGAIRKLCSDGYVEKFGQNPVIYNLTEKGKNFNINEYKGNMNNGKENEE